jgi:hypothetical protein
MTTTLNARRVEPAWKDVDRYIESTLVHSDDALDAALARSAAAGLRVSATAIQTVGVKGYDGFAMMVVN